MESKKIIILIFYILVMSIIFRNYIDDQYNYQMEMLLSTTPDQIISANDKIPMQTIGIYGVPVLASQFPYIRGFILERLTKTFGTTILESEKLLFLIFIILAAYSTFLLSYHLSRNYIISFGIGFLYAFLPSSIYSFVFGELSLFIFYSLTPLLVYSYIKILSSEINYYSELFCGLLLGFAALNQPQVMIYDSLLFIIIFIYFLLIKDKSRAIDRPYLKKILIQNLIVLTIFLLSIIWWLYPVAFIYKDIQLPSPATSIDVSLLWNSNFWKLISMSAFTLGMAFPIEAYTSTYPFFIFFFIIISIYPIFQKNLHEKDQLISVFLISYFIYFSLSLGVQIQKFYFNTYYIFLILILCILIGLYFYKHNFYLSIYFSIFLIFLLGWHPSTYKWLFENIPLFYMFRTPNRFTFMVTFSGVLLFGYFFKMILENFKKYRNYIYISFGLLVMLYSVIGINEIYQLGMPKIEKNYFNDYYDIINFIKNDKADFRVAILPTRSQEGLDIYDVWHEYSPLGGVNGINWMREFLIKEHIRIADTVTTNLISKNNFAYWQSLDISARSSDWNNLANKLKRDWSIKYIIILKKYLRGKSQEQLKTNNNFVIIHENKLFILVKNKNWRNELITDNISVVLDKKFPMQNNKILSYKFKSPDLVEIMLKNNNPISIFLAVPYFEGWYVRNTDGEKYQMYAINHNLTIAGSIDNIKNKRVFIEFLGKGSYNFWFQYMYWYYPIIIILIVALYVRRNIFKKKLQFH